MPENTNNETTQIYHQHPKQEGTFLRFVKQLWYRFKATKLFQAFRHSRLNPFHTRLLNIKTETLNEAREIAIQKNLQDFIYKGVRISTDEPYSIPQEADKRCRIFRNGRNALDVLPRNANGIPDLTAEEPIMIAIIPIEGPSLAGHAALQYKDYVVNRMRYKMDTKPLFPRYGNNADYYFIYPSQVGIDPKRLICAINKTNVLRSGKYDFLTNNCAGAVDYTLRQAGVTDLDQYGPDRLGIFFTAPGNNPFHKGIQEWCRKHGVHVFSDEIKQVYKYNYIDTYQIKAEHYQKARERLVREKKYKRSFKYVTKKACCKITDLIGISKPEKSY